VFKSHAREMLQMDAKKIAACFGAIYLHKKHSHLLAAFSTAFKAYQCFT
jgi:hypothetical protein